MAFFVHTRREGTIVSRKETQKPGRVLLLPIDSIEPSPYQARTAFDEPEIAALAVSILQNGLLQPVSVRRVGLRKYQLVAGERRLRACRLAKLEKIPAILADYDDSESAALGLLENLLGVADFLNGGNHREHDAQITILGCTQQSTQLGQEQIGLVQADTDCTIAEEGVLLLLQLECGHFLIAADIQRTDDDRLARHRLACLLVSVELFFLARQIVTIHKQEL